MDQGISPEVQKSKDKVTNLEVNSLNLALGALAGLGSIILLFLILNYFNILSFSTLYPKQFGWLPHQSTTKYIDPNTQVLRIDDKVITYREFNSIEYVTELALKDKKLAIERTKELMIMNTLLKKEALNQHRPFNEKDFQSYQNARGINTSSIDNNPARRLEEEIAFLKNKQANDLTWYSGEYFLVRFENDLSIPVEEKKTRARAKLEEIKRKYETGVSFRQMMELFKNDKELNDLNQQQGFGNTFEKMTLERPQITSPEILSIIPKLKPNTVSDIFVFSDPKRLGHTEPVPFAYAFVKLTDYHYGIASSFDQWYENAKRNAKIVINETVLQQL